MSARIADRLIAADFMKDAERGNPLTLLLRLFAAPFAISALRFKIHPNVVTALSLMLGCAGALLYISDFHVLFFVAWTLSVILDYADGIVARKSGKESYFGQLLDMLGDRVKLIALLAAWAAVERHIAATALAATVVFIILSTECLVHLFVARRNIPQTVQVGLRTSFQHIFINFDMHSFLLYGFGVFIGGAAGWLATAWLLSLLAAHFAKEWRGRSGAGSGGFVLNRSLLGRLRIGSKGP